ncbi:hypothetical protein ACQKCH_10705 [Nubsella zeaxanthinifaciens]|uniref:hypothetical protein n=1 Tax=Nubsella zeaxanthinifaciens TaxID=392412 RepID=UPI003D067A73
MDEAKYLKICIPNSLSRINAITLNTSMSVKQHNTDDHIQIALEAGLFLKMMMESA